MEVHVKDLSELVEELKRELVLQDSPIIRYRMPNTYIELELGKVVNYYSSENLKITLRLARVLENNVVVIAIIEKITWRDYIIAEEYIKEYKISAFFKAFVDKEYYKKVKKYEETKFVEEHIINLKIKSKEELFNFIRANKDNRSLITRLTLELTETETGSGERLRKLLGFKDINEVLLFVKQALM